MSRSGKQGVHIVEMARVPGRDQVPSHGTKLGAEPKPCPQSSRTHIRHCPWHPPSRVSSFQFPGTLVGFVTTVLYIV